MPTSLVTLTLGAALVGLIAVAQWRFLAPRLRRSQARRFLEKHHPAVLSTPKTRKVLLIHPTTHLTGGVLYKEKLVFTPALTLPLLAALTPPHWEVELCYETSEEIPWDTDAQVVGLSNMGHSLWRAFEIAREFRKRGKHVVIGGTMASLVPDLAQAECDTLFIGDAELTWPRFLQDFEQGRPQPTYVASERHVIAELPVPRYDLLLAKSTVGLMMPVQIARGCCHHCRFCTITALSAGNYTPRPVDQILRDILSLREFGRKFFFFLDDNLAADAPFARGLFQQVSGLGIRWASQSTLDILKDPTLLPLAVESGCITLCFGLESLTQKSLGNVGKGFLRASDYDGQLASIHQSGLMETAEFIIGLDHDTPEAIEQLAEFIIERTIPLVRAYIFAPIPGTPVCQEFREAGRLLEQDYTRIGGSNVGFRPANFTPDGLLAAYWKLMDRIYSWPAILRRVFLRPSRGPFDTLVALAANVVYRRQVKKRIVPGQA